MSDSRPLSKKKSVVMSRHGDMGLSQGVPTAHEDTDTEEDPDCYFPISMLGAVRERAPGIAVFRSHHSG